MKLDKVLLAIIGALCLVTLWVLLLPEPEGILGVDHPLYASMRYGGSGGDRHGSLLWAGWAFGAVGIVLYVALMAFGTRAGAHRRAIARWLVLGLGAYLAAWTWVVVAYGSGVSGGATGFFLGFPAPVAIMLYVLCPVSLVFAAVYVVGFDHWVLSEEDEAAYERLVARTRDPGRESGDTATGSE